MYKKYGCKVTQKLYNFFNFIISQLTSILIQCPDYSENTFITKL